MEFVDLVQAWLYNLAVAILPIIGAFVVAYLKALIEKKMVDIAEAKPQLADAIRQAVNLAVKAAEQAGFAGFVDEKKQYALNIAQIWLNENGWDEVDIDVLEAAIEAEVLALFNEERGEKVQPAGLWNSSAW